MSIERLNKAVVAAGFAMAAPDDDVTDEVRPAAVGESAARDIVVASRSQDAPAARGSLQVAKDWMRSMVPSFGGRAPA